MAEYIKELQTVLLEIALEVKRICEKHNFQYFLIAGTLLGAVRHKGFIPWDDDFDIVMPRKDYDSFIKCCSKELNAKYFLHCHETDSRFWQFYAKVRKNDTFLNERTIQQIDTHKGIFIDIFPLDNAKYPSGKLLLLQSKSIYFLSEVICRKRGLNLGVAANKKMRVMLLIAKAFSINTIARFQRRIMTLYKNQHTDYWTIFDDHLGYLNNIIPKDKYLPDKELEFEKILFKVPNDSDFILTRFYGDYMRLPPIEQRVGEHVIEIKFKHS